MSRFRRSRHRHEVEVCASILSTVADGPMRKTWIMNDVNLNHSVVTKHLHRLMDCGFLSCDEEESLYKLTDAGRDFLEEYDKFKLLAEKMMLDPD
jgi:predicted transcriptional regulator